MQPGATLPSVARMKHLSTAALAAAAVLALVATTASGHSSATTIALVQKDHHFQFVDVAPKGGLRKPPSQGDQYVIGGNLTASGKTAGLSNLVCTITQPGKNGISECVGTVILAKGTISFGGVSHIVTSGDTFAVTGGTGAYVGVRGVLIGSQGTGGSTNITVKLS
jgi:hypothetical protein